MKYITRRTEPLNFIVDSEEHLGYKSPQKALKTKALKTWNFEKIAETDKIRCGRKRFKEIDTNFDVAVSANEV